MKTFPELVDALEAAGARLSVRLVVDALAGAIGDDLRAALAEHRPRLLERLGREALWAVLREERWGPAAGEPPPHPPPARVGPREPGDDDDDGPSDATGHRAVIATWSIPERRRWGELANAYEDQGLAWDEAERRAFEELNREDLR